MKSSSETIKTLARNIKANPNDSFSKFALGLEFLKQDNLSRARLLFEDVYQRDPEYVGLYYHLGRLYERIERFEDARRMYREGIEVADHQKELRTKKELEEALAQLNIQMED